MVQRSGELSNFLMDSVGKVPFGVFPKIGVPPKSSILIGCSIINHPFWGTPIFGSTHLIFDG